MILLCATVIVRHDIPWGGGGGQQGGPDTLLAVFFIPAWVMVLGFVGEWRFCFNLESLRGGSHCNSCTAGKKYCFYINRGNGTSRCLSLVLCFSSAALARHGITTYSLPSL